MYFEELILNQPVTLESVVMKKDDMIAFSEKYDNIPLHTNEDYAKKTPFKGLIASGMMTYLEVWAKYIDVDFFGDELLAGQSTSIRWLKPVFPGDVLTGTVAITKLVERNEKNGTAVLEIRVRNQHNECVMTCEAEAVVKRKRLT